MEADEQTMNQWHNWFHAIDFGNATSQGRFPANIPPNYTLYSVFEFLKDISVEGQTCLDLGTMDGLVAFMLKKKKAGRVVASCQHDRPQFRYGCKVLGYEDIEYLPGLDLSQMQERFGKGSFDLVVMAGVIYHLLDPLNAIAIARKLLKKNGLLLLETAYTAGDQPALILNTETPTPLQEVMTYWLPTKSAVNGMLKFATFDVLGSAASFKSGRIGFLARASKPSEVKNRTPQLANTQANALWTGILNFKAMETGTGPCSSIEYRGQGGDSSIDIYTFQSDLPFQPQWKPVR